MRDVTLNQQEQARIQVLNSVLEYQLPIAQAAEIMGVSERHAKLLLAAYRRDGAVALAHGNRGRRPHNAVPEAAAAAVVKLTVPRQAFLPIWRQLFLPIHLLIPTPLLGSVGAIAGDVEFQDDGVMHHPVDGRRGGHGVGEDALPL